MKRIMYADIFYLFSVRHCPLQSPNSVILEISLPRRSSTIVMVNSYRKRRTFSVSFNHVLSLHKIVTISSHLSRRVRSICNGIIFVCLSHELRSRMHWLGILLLCYSWQPRYRFVACFMLYLSKEHTGGHFLRHVCSVISTVCVALVVKDSHLVDAPVKKFECGAKTCNNP